LIGAQDDRQLARLTCMCDALRHGVLAEGHTIEEPQRADDLVQAWPGHSSRNQMKLEGMHFLQAQSVRGVTKMAAKLRHRMDIGLVRSRGHTVERDVFDHAAAKRADLSHRKTSCLKGWALTPTILSDRKRVLRLPSTAAPAASFNPS